MIYFVHLPLHCLPLGRGACLEDLLPPNPSTVTCLEGTRKDISSSCCNFKLQFFLSGSYSWSRRLKQTVPSNVTPHQLPAYKERWENSPVLSAIWGQMSPELRRASLASVFSELLMLTLNFSKHSLIISSLSFWLRHPLYMLETIFSSSSLHQCWLLIHFWKSSAWAHQSKILSSPLMVA